MQEGEEQGECQGSCLGLGLQRASPRRCPELGAEAQVGCRRKQAARRNALRAFWLVVSFSPWESRRAFIQPDPPFVALGTALTPVELTLKVTKKISMYSIHRWHIR